MARLGPIIAIAASLVSITPSRGAEPLPQDLAPGARTALRSMLDSAAHRGPGAAAAAQQQFRIAQELSGADDRLARYVYGVVLARLMQTKDSQLELGLAAETSDGPYPPAYVAWLQSLMMSREWVPAANGVQRFGKAIESVPSAWSDDGQRLADARWLGRSVAAAESLVTTPADVQRWSEVDAALRKTLQGDRLVAYSEGFEAALVQQEQLSRAAEEARQQAAVDQAEQIEAERRSLATKKAQVQSSQDNLKLNAEENKTQFENQSAELAKQLGKLEQQWTRQDNQRQSLERSILLVQQEMYQLQEQYRITSAGTNRNRNTMNTVDQTRLRLIDQRLAQRQLQLFNYQNEHTQTLTSMNQIQQQATLILKQQSDLAIRFQQVTGELTRYDSDLDKWTARLKRQEAKLEEQPDGNTNAVRALERKQQAFATYSPWDWEAERVRLLAIYDIP